MMSDAGAVAHELAGVLEREISLLRTGAVAEASKLASQKLQHLEILEQAIRAMSHADRCQLAPSLSRIERLGRENAILLEACRNGLRMMIKRLEASGSDTSAGVYRPDGREQVFGYAKGFFDTKA